MYYLNLDDDNYLLSINELDDGNPSIESIEEYDFSGVRLPAYRYEDGQLIFDQERYEQLSKHQEELEEEAYIQSIAPTDAELAAVELAEITSENAARLDEQDAALCELAAMLAELVGGDV